MFEIIKKNKYLFLLKSNSTYLCKMILIFLSLFAYAKSVFISPCFEYKYQYISISLCHCHKKANLIGSLALYTRWALFFTSSMPWYTFFWIRFWPIHKKWLRIRWLKKIGSDWIRIRNADYKEELNYGAITAALKHLGKKCILQT